MTELTNKKLAIISRDLFATNDKNLKVFSFQHFKFVSIDAKTSEL